MTPRSKRSSRSPCRCSEEQRVPGLARQVASDSRVSTRQQGGGMTRGCERTDLHERVVHVQQASCDQSLVRLLSTSWHAVGVAPTVALASNVETPFVRAPKASLQILHDNTSFTSCSGSNSEAFSTSRASSFYRYFGWFL